MQYNTHRPHRSLHNGCFSVLTVHGLGGLRARVPDLQFVHTRTPTWQLDDVRTLAKEKVRMSDLETLALRQTFQRNPSHHTGMWRAALAGVIESFTQVESAVAAGADLTTAMPLRSTSAWKMVFRASEGPIRAEGSSPLICSTMVLA